VIDESPFNLATAPQEAAVTSIDEPGRQMMFRTIMLIVAVEPLVIIGILIAVGVPWIATACIAGIGLIVATMIFGLIVLLGWRPLSRRWPAQPILPGAVSKSWQSLGVGYVARWSNCITVIADERHLHFVPFAPMRWLGARRMSLPLDRIREVRTGLLPGMMTAQIDGRRLSAPEWCLRLASEGHES
jgi:hypothetical protein